MLRVFIGFLISNLFWLTSTVAADSGWMIGVQHWRDTHIEETDGNPISRASYHAGYRWLTDTSTLITSYTHQPILIRAGEPAHNGYFHQLNFQVSRAFSRTRVGITGGIHGTSNMFKYGDFHGEAAVATFSVLHPVDAMKARLGVNGDYRFGPFQLYPRFGREYAMAQGSVLIVDLPIAAAWQSAGKKWSVGIEKYGNKWATLDKQREVESDFYLEEWRLKGRRQIRSQVYVEVGLSIDTQITYQDTNSGRRRESLDNAFYFAVGWKSF